MAAALRHAEGGPVSAELALLSYIDRWGAQSVLGRPMSAGEIRRMLIAERIAMAYRSRETAKNWATWAIENEEEANLLAMAQQVLSQEEEEA